MPARCPCCLQILYSYPGGTSLVTQMMEQVPHFCFPHGVQPLLLERTPSMSALNEVIYSQQYQNSDGCSFIFLMKVWSCQSCSGIPPDAFPNVLSALVLLSLAKIRSWPGRWTCFRPSGLLQPAEPDLKLLLRLLHKGRQLVGEAGCQGHAMSAWALRLATEQAEEDTQPSI